MRKKLLSLALALVMTLTLLPASALAEEPATDGTAPTFTAVPQDATIFDKTVSALQDNDITVGTVTDGKYPVTGTVKYVEDWTKFNESNKNEQTGFYVALSIPGSIGTDANAKNVTGLKLPAEGGTKEKEYTSNTTPTLSSVFSDGDSDPKSCYVAFFLGADEAAAKEKTIKISLKYGDAADYTDYTFSFAGLTYTGAPAEISVVPANLTGYTEGKPAGDNAATYTATLDADKKEITVTATGLKKTTNTANVTAYWVGVGITAQDKATYATGWGAFDGTKAEYVAADSTQVVDGKTYATMYWGAGSASDDSFWTKDTSKTGYLSVKVDNGEPTTYTIKFNVEVATQTAEQWTVTFDANGGTGTMDVVKVNKDPGTYNLPECKFTAPSGKKFAGWLVGDDAEVKDADTQITVTADVTIKASWVDDTQQPVDPAITAVTSKTSGVTATFANNEVTLSGELAAPATGTAGTVTLSVTYTDATGAEKTKDVNVSLTYVAADGTNPASWTIPADVTVDSGLKATLKGTVSVKTTQSTDEVIESVAITLVPSAGVNVGDTLPTATTETEGVTLKTDWKNENNAAVTKADAAGTYTATITVMAETGYVLKEDGVSYTIDGKAPESTTVSKETLTYTLEVKPATPTLTFAVYNVTTEDIKDLGGADTVKQLGAFTMSTSGTTVTVGGTADYVSLPNFNGVATDENEGHYLPISITGKAGDVITLTNRSDGAKDGKDFTLGADGKLDTIVWLDGTQTITGLAEKTFTVQVTRDGVSNTYTVNFSKVTLAQKGDSPVETHTVTLNQPVAGGTLSATVDNVAISDKVEKGKDVVITATPAEGYQFESLTVDGTAVTATVDSTTGVATYTISQLDKDVIVAVVFEQKPAQSYGITVTEIEKDADNKPIGSVTIDETAKAGATVEFTVTPASGYTLKSVAVKNGDTVIQPTKGDNGKYTFTMPAADVTITAVFEKVTPDAPSVDANIPVTPTVSGETAAAEVTDSTVTAAIDKAIQDAKDTGKVDPDAENVPVDNVTINAAATGSDASSVKTANVTLPAATVETLVDKEVSTVTVETNVGTVSLPQEVLTKTGAGDDQTTTTPLTLVVEKKDTASVNPGTGNTVTAAYDVKVQTVDGGQTKDVEINGLNKTAPITLSFNIGTGLTSNPTLAYVDSGVIKKIASSKYNSTTGIITGTITHLTEIVVVNPEAISDYYTISGTTDGVGGAGKTLVVNLTGNYDGKQMVTACFTYELDNGKQIVTSMTQAVVKGTQQASFSYSGTPAKIVLYVSSSLPNLTGGNLNTTVYDSVTK